MVEDGKLAFQPKLKMPCGSVRRNGNELFVGNKYGCERLLLTTGVLKLY